MKRAIYVGKGLSAVSYGMTGTMQPSISPESPYFAFRPDGKMPGQWFVMRKDLYVASEDQTKYYPNNHERHPRNPMRNPALLRMRLPRKGMAE